MAPHETSTAAELPIHTKDATPSEKKFGKALRDDFLFAPTFKNLNHGSFGTYPAPVRTVLHSFQSAAESRPDPFIRYTYKEALDSSRAALATTFNAPVESLVFVPNASTGVNTVLRNLVFAPGDAVVYFSTIYGACEKAVLYIAETTPAKAVRIEYTQPVEDAWLVDALRNAVRDVEAEGGKVRVAIFDTITSMPGVRMPFEDLIATCRSLGVLSLVDAAHGAGQIPLDLGKLDPDFLVSNCHKWMFVPRGCALFYVPVRNQHLMRSTLPTSHGFEPAPREGVAAPKNPLPKSSKSTFVTNFEFVGTIDNAPYLCVPAALKYRAELGGEDAIYAYLEKLAREGGALVAKELGTEVLENKAGTLQRCAFANVRLPLARADVEKWAEKGNEPGVEIRVIGHLERRAMDEFDTFFAICWYAGAWWVRLSAQVYLDIADFEWAASVLKTLCGGLGELEGLE
ncbi:PLP-dependent transferase [Trichodelitschia bisporula]|uniref:PLP-dependent transferase n=1 Tax=Trichodelitschia bisporula TaxID=703511 RepID=A0A6G1I072_9PEZI|nr:PLP-dependent transferase [Trichodelitschia bisporula]